MSMNEQEELRTLRRDKILMQQEINYLNKRIDELLRVNHTLRKKYYRQHAVLERAFENVCELRDLLN